MVLMAYFSIGLLTFCELVTSCRLLVVFEVVLYREVALARLFLVYINDLMDVFNADVNCKLYADDVKLYSLLK